MTQVQSKRDRQAAILELLRSHPVRTQEELAQELHRRRIDADQATISRDLRQLGVARAVAGSERRYLAPAEADPRSRLMQILATQLLGSDLVGAMLVLHTASGAAAVVAAAVDSLQLPQVAGTVAGDDTIFVQARSPREARAVLQRLDHAVRDYGAGGLVAGAAGGAGG